MIIPQLTPVCPIKKIMFPGLHLMLTYLRLPVIFLLLMCIFSPFMVSAAIPALLQKPPLGDRWFGIYFNDERTGFATSSIRETSDGYEMLSASSIKMGGFGFSRDASIRESYSVNKDLTLKSFAVTQVIDGKHNKLSGEVIPAGIRAIVESAGVKKERVLKRKGAVYPPMALNLYPSLQGIEKGKSYRLAMFDPEAIKIKAVKVSVVGIESINGTEAIHLRNNLYPIDNDIWVDGSGNTIKESIRDGWILTLAEDEKSSQLFISQAAVAKKALILDYSLIKIDTTITKPDTLGKLKLQISGIPATMQLLSGGVQKAERQEDGNVLFTMDQTLLQTASEPLSGNPNGQQPYLEPTEQILSANPEIISKKDQIIGAERDPLKIVEKLAIWVAANIKETDADSQLPTEVLKNLAGNCQSHTRLYLSLARAAGIPSKFVSGISYFPGKGFLYHSWAESHVGYWLPVDPTLGELPADLTHIRLVEGDSPEDALPLAALVGNITVKVLEQRTDGRAKAEAAAKTRP
jgi:hypothetical protein